MGICSVSELVSRRCAELSLCQYGDLSIPVAEVHTDLSKLSLVAEQVGCEEVDGKDVEACHVVGLQGDEMVKVSPSSCSECRRPNESWT